MKRKQRSRGQALVEFAVVLPVFIVAILGIFDFGRVIWARNMLETAARSGARYAIVHGDTNGQTCPVGPAEGKWVDLGSAPAAPDTWTTCPYPACPLAHRSGDTCSNWPVTGSPSYNLRQSIYDAAKNAVVAGGSNVTVTACYGTSCSGNTDISPATTVRSTAITVQITSTMNLVVPSLLHLGSFTVVGTSTMYINH
jgi:hypothetical protein